MKVSIIIPVYNVEKYLKKCLNTAVNQTLDDIEIICINDGSTDNSINILRDYNKKYSKLVVIDQSNKGVSCARNTGIKVARGEYIYFLDSDDYIDLNSMLECYEEAKKNDLDILTFDADCFYDSEYSDIQFEQSFDRSSLIKSEIMVGEDFYIYSNVKSAYRSTVWLNFYKREFIETNELYFLEGIIHEDEIYTSTSFIKAKKVKYINKKFFYRRVRNNSIMTSNISKARVDGNLVIAEASYKLYSRINLKKESKKILLAWIRLYYKNCITLCDAMELNQYKRKITESINSRNEVMDIDLRMQLEVPNLFYSK